MATSTDESTNQSSVSMDQSQDGLQTIDQSETSLFSNKGDHSDSEDEENETYYFESDHVALKGNHDYHVVLRTIALLEAQRIQAVKDLDRLYEGRKEALKDPIQFVQKLQRGVDLQLPKPQKIAELPDINWEKYTSQLDFSSFGTHRHMTRLKRQLMDGNQPSQSTDDTKPCPMDPDSVVRGRVKTESKSETFNQLWTSDEQARLEELLLVYPPEEVEAKRFQKIAVALGNRTTLQVQSRVQKYFIKLAKAGLPIPGRMPNMLIHKKKSFGRPRGMRMPYNTSTFLASVTPPVFMNDEDEDNSQGGYDGSGYEGSVISGMEEMDQHDDNVSDDEGVPVELRHTPEYQELMRLKQLRTQKLRHNTDAISEHLGFKCDSCDCEPIVGTRWHCTDCPPDVAVDFCDDCVDCGYETTTHNSSHRLKPKHRPDSSGYMDTDYLGFMPGGSCTGYNYLDPNYMPAS